MTSFVLHKIHELYFCWSSITLQCNECKIYLLIQCCYNLTPSSSSEFGYFFLSSYQDNFTSLMMLLFIQGDFFIYQHDTEFIVTRLLLVFISNNADKNLIFPEPAHSC